MKRTAFAVLVAVPLLVSTGVAWSAEQAKEGEAVASVPAISLEQAIKAATAEFPGQVVEAELENEDGKTVYQVEIVGKNGESREFVVDAQSGKVTAGEPESEKEKESEKDGK